jgi:hypothetical protein
MSRRNRSEEPVRTLRRNTSLDEVRELDRVVKKKLAEEYGIKTIGQLKDRHLDYPTIVYQCMPNTRSSAAKNVHLINQLRSLRLVRRSTPPPARSVLSDYS